MRKLSLLLFLLLSFSSFASDCLTDVGTSFTDDGKIIIAYTLTSADPTNTLPVFAINFTGWLAGKKSFTLKTLDGPGKTGVILGEGTFTSVWNVAKDFKNADPNAFNLDVKAEEVTDKARYLCLDLKKYKMRCQNEQPDIKKAACKTKELWLKRVEPGIFVMGSPEDEIGRSKNETQHSVTITKAFYIGVFETTQKQFKAITGYNASTAFKGAARPADSVSYVMLRGANKGSGWPSDGEIDQTYSCEVRKGKKYVTVERTTFFNALRNKTGNALLFDLPTEAQWEYACRAGMTTAWNNGADITNSQEDPELNKLGRYYFNGGIIDGKVYGHAKAGLFSPNAWGFYDMHGNVSEWCLDWCRESQNRAPITDPVGISEGQSRVLRSGNWNDHAENCRSASNIGEDPGNAADGCGFRVMLGQKTLATSADPRSFEYEVSSDTDNTLPIFKPRYYAVFKDGTKVPLDEMGKLEFEGAHGLLIGEGKYQLKWIPDLLYDDFEFLVEYEDVSSQAAYLIIDLLTNEMRFSEEGPDLSDDRCRTEELWLRRIEPASFTMGSPGDELGRKGNETSHKVTLTKACYIGVFETTQKQFEIINGDNPSSNKGDGRPVETVSFDSLRGGEKGALWPANNEFDGNSFFGKLRSKTGITFDLPTEAQWEYACRAEAATALNSGKDLTATNSCPNMDEVGRYYFNKDDGEYNQHTKVGSYAPNAWGLYDMHGNVGEWCLDRYRANRSEAPKTDPVGNGEGNLRTICGGSWEDFSGDCRSASHIGQDSGNVSDSCGFRIALWQKNECWPLEPKTFEFEILSDTRNTFPIFESKFFAVFKDGEKVALEDMGRLEGNGALGLITENGKYSLTFLPDDLYDGFEFEFEVEDVSSKATYLVFDLLTSKMRFSEEGPDLNDDRCRTEELWLRRIEPGSFFMGSRTLEIGCAEDETKHKVEFTEAYYVGVFEFTQRQYEIVNGEASSLDAEGKTCPVGGLSYDELRGFDKGASWPSDNSRQVDDGSFFAKLRSKTGCIFDLPTEAQWEFACRAGSATSLNDGTKLNDVEIDANLDKLGWYYDNSGDTDSDTRQAHCVGQKLPNVWGLYDMLGNAQEWCLDWYGEYPGVNVKDPKGVKSGSGRVLRGGDIFSSAGKCRSASRNYSAPNEAGDQTNSCFGFRAALFSSFVAEKEEGSGVKEEFKYSIDSETENTLPVYKVKFYGRLNDVTEYLLEDIGKLADDGAAGLAIGKDEHHVTWIPDKAYVDLAGRLELRVEYEDVTDQAAYLVLDLQNNKMRVSSEGPDIASDKCRTDELWLRRIEPGTFLMGSPMREEGRTFEESQHEVKLVKAYYIGVFEFTQRQYEIVTGFNPSIHIGDKTRPVDCVSYDDLRGDKLGATWPSETDHRVDDGSFFAKLRNKAGNLFDLPTEAQWEFACRAGTTNAWNDGTNHTGGFRDHNLDNLGWYNPSDPNLDNGDDYYGYDLHTSPVGKKLPNAWGLYDMHGNVKEWCLDWYINYGGPSVEPVGAYSAYDRVLRGGDILNRANKCRSASRGYCRPHSDGYFYNYCLGFRAVITSNLVIEDEENIVKESFVYTVDSDTENTLPVFQVRIFGKLKSGDEYPLEDLGRLENDGAAGLVFGKGEHSLTWFPTSDYTNLVGQLELRVEYEDVTEQATYLVLNLPSNKMRVSAAGPNLTNDLCRTDELWLRRIEPGTFTMGSPEDEFGRYQGSTMEDQHGVTLSKAYYIGIFETTQKQFELIAGYNPSEYSGAVLPVDFVSYNDLRGAIKGQNWPADRNVDDDSFFGSLRARAGNNFDLPTEAQWEFACRAGTNTGLNDGNNITNKYSDGCLNKLGRYWANHNQGGYTYSTAVGSYLPNAWGLYDMHGNVMEWCLDWYKSYREDVVDPKGSEHGDYRMLRGGSWESHAYVCRSAFRDLNYLPGYTNNRFGFRIVLVP